MAADRRWGALWLALAWLVASSAAGSPASAQDDTKKACTDAYVENQKLRKQGELTAARTELITCAQDRCPGAIRVDCVRWLSEIEQNIPTVVIAAKGRDGNDTTRVRVFVDGEKVADDLDGRPMAIDPGVHRLRFEHQDAPAVEREIVVQQGVKNRPVSVSFAAATAPPVDAAPAEELEAGPPVPWAVVAVLGVLSVGGIATFAGLGITAKNEADELDRTCGSKSPQPPEAKGCPQEDIDAVRAKLIGADVALAAGSVLGALTLGLLIWNLTSDGSSTSASVQLVPGPGGVHTGLDLRF